MTRTSPQPVSSRSRASAATAFPKAMPPALRCWSMSRPGSRSIIPAAFAAALLNSQPMGFYAPAEIVRCARDHGRDGAGARCRFQRLGLHPGARRNGACACGWAFARSTASRKTDGRHHHGMSAAMAIASFADFARRTALAQARAGDPGGGRCLSQLRAGSPRRAVGGAPAARRRSAAAVRAARRAGDGRGDRSRPCPSCR